MNLGKAQLCNYVARVYITNSIYIQECLTPFPAELLPLNKVSMGSTAASTPMMVTFTPPLHIGEIRVSNVSTIFYQNM